MELLHQGEHVYRCVIIYSVDLYVTYFDNSSSFVDADESTLTCFSTGNVSTMYESIGL